MLMLVTDHLFTSSMGWYCLWYWICEIRILLLEWNHILFMGYVIWFKVLRNKMWFMSGSMYAGAFVFSCCIATLLTSLVFDSISFEGFQVAQHCHLMLPQQEKDRPGPSGTEGALLVGWLESIDWQYDALCRSFSSKHLWPSLSFTGKTKCASVPTLVLMNNLNVYESDF